ncbi:MAG: type II toxin-antitoxin system HicA family toxin [Methanosarcinales archaeon]|nr:type II toxin-antitoxin system HicA family toxin [Methanosarcinales archaeon]MCD4814978.1 type II toxin-antitoxin system HicA family toxin [Methanosarcinales archaeon]
MTRLKVINSTKLEKLLLKLGFKKIRQKGSHVLYRNHIMILLAQTLCNRRPCAFIHNEPHLTGLYSQRRKCGVFKGFCCK